MAGNSIPTPPPLTGDDITHFRCVISGGRTNPRQRITVEVISLVDDGQASPPILTTHGNLDMTPDQAVHLADTLTEARRVYADALASHWESLA